MATLMQHPKLEVSKLAAAVVEKWRGLGEVALLEPGSYDVEAAAGAPDGVPDGAAAGQLDACACGVAQAAAAVAVVQLVLIPVLHV